MQIRQKIKRHVNKNISWFFIIFGLLSFPFASFAADKSDKETVSLKNPLTGESGEDANVPPQEIIGDIISGVLGVVGSLALLMFIYGGLVWMTSSGNSEKVQKGKNILVWATLGLVVIFASYALVNFVLTDIINAPNAG